MNFGQALDLLKHGHRVTRMGGIGVAMWLQLHRPTPGERMTESFIFAKTARSGMTPWSPSQADMLAEDWEVLPDENPATVAA